MKTGKNNASYLYLIFIIFILLSCIPAILLSFDFIVSDGYSEFLSILDKGYIKYCYPARVILDNLNYTSFNVFSLILSFIHNLGIFEYIILICVLYFIASYHERSIAAYQKIWEIVLYIYVFMVSIICIILIVGFSLSNLHTVLSLFHIVGYVLLITHILLIIWCLYSMRYIFIEIYKKK